LRESLLLQNSVLVAALAAWLLAQIFKLPLQYLRERSWDWTVLVRPGGMPSSHSALISAGAHGVGLTAGFDSPVFALGVVIAMIVIYDATGVRRQAGRHAEIINAMVRDLFEGHQLNQEQLREVLGHSPIEALVGLLLGLSVAQWLVPLLESLP
jgi:acid phosphatase family membrane protein YuiD